MLYEFPNLCDTTDLSNSVRIRLYEAILNSIQVYKGTIQEII